MHEGWRFIITPPTPHSISSNTEEEFVASGQHRHDTHRARRAHICIWSHTTLQTRARIGIGSIAAGAVDYSAFLPRSSYLVAGDAARPGNVMLWNWKEEALLVQVSRYERGGGGGVCL